jgi:hypothetical protein
MKPLDEIKKENPFKVPEGYFESLTDRTMSAIRESSESEKSPEENIRRKIRLMPFLAMAAAIIGFAVIAAGMVRLVTKNENNLFRGSDNEFYAEIITQDIDTYIIENEWGLYEEAIGGEEYLETEAIIDYLLLENIALTDIYETL